ncbi:MULTISPECIES: DUF4176 domain-containing protein [Enterococcus]|uniref:DUF4176 domain-containing protein n=1 Tax=Enterococcus TaxID=1350 RepID=UPI000CF2A309|nr:MULTISPECIES: DUF4176 domain-containing protein [Enterococcus]EGP5737900.1 DUF4176 domain-containing protein [Enterococcus faecium]EME7182685.1 DUF4176 domain-containing protein [Enterococcus faecium]MCA6757155.1 DUF4176 domain-containing protein [Enterococcus lactis]MEB5584213.1 DUF4176 domain-containing protein [Enterococcus faecium]NTQ56347.1 DUF4176 domain-containing protein [Enterococcus faecium]
MMLPIGSIVYLSEGNQKIMILNRGPLAEQHGKKVFFDYTGALYPQGLDPEQVYYFNDEDIDEVVFEGFKDEDEERFVKLYKKWVAKNSGKINRGNVDVPSSIEDTIYGF